MADDTKRRHGYESVVQSTLQLLDLINIKMPHNYKVIKTKTGFKIKSKQKTFKRTFKSKKTAEATIRNLYKLAAGNKGHKKKY